LVVEFCQCCGGEGQVGFEVGQDVHAQGVGVAHVGLEEGLLLLQY
jgi:hypothetical protein